MATEQRKKCSKCEVEKSLLDFSRDRQARDGLRNRCRECMSKIWKDAYKKDPEKWKARVKIWAENNPKNGEEPKKTVSFFCDTG